MRKIAAFVLKKYAKLIPDVLSLIHQNNQLFPFSSGYEEIKENDTLMFLAPGHFEANVITTVYRRSSICLRTRPQVS